MTVLPKSYEPSAVEEKWYRFWKENGFFRANATSSKKPYSIVIPPPNVTGALHMGHALVDTVQDILIRWKRMSGFEALWVPGTDHAGIATQTVVERHLIQTTGKRRADFSRDEFIAHIWDWKKKYEGQILKQLEKLGCSCDWSRLRFTMDEGCNRAVKACFKKMFDQKLIYRGDYLVNWDPVQQTAISDDEVEYEEADSFLWFIRYGEITVATTRPETMLGDTAIAVHPEDERYQKFIGKKIKLPLTDREIPVIGDPFVDSSFGTGAVKITPAHDLNDFEAARRHHLPMINILTPDARINENGGRFANLSVEEARHQVIAELKKLGLIEKIEPHHLRIGRSYRSKAIIQPYLSKQWFLKMSPFKEALISAVKEKRVTLIPPHWEQTYLHWIENLRDWCISRQLWWGHRIPIWYNKNNPEEILCTDSEEEPSSQDWVQDPDVLDTWFSSGLWPLSTLGWPDQTDDLKKFYPTSTLITGHDILFFWVARMILMGEYLENEPPFHEAFLHGLIYGKSYWRTAPDGGVEYLHPSEKKTYDLGAPIPLDVSSKWEKMSKTKGNIIDPLEIIQEYGTDALRITLCSSVTHARQIDLDLRRFEEFKNFANKIWNGARFVFMNLEGLTPGSFAQGIKPDLFTLEDRWILSLLNRTLLEMDAHLDSYAFDKAAMRSYEFFWNDFCAVYLEAIKPTLFGKVGDGSLKENKQKLLAILLMNAIRLLHPITPFITEELFSCLKEMLPVGKMSHKVDPYTKGALDALQAPACIVAPYPTVIAEEDIDLAVEEEFARITQLIRSIRNLRGEMQIPPSEKTEVYFDSLLENEHQNLILALTPTSKILTKEPSSFGASTLSGTTKIFIPIPETMKIKEKARLEKEYEKLQKLKEATSAKLANEEFRLRAPKEVVEKLENALLQTQSQLDEIVLKLDAFK